MYSDTIVQVSMLFREGSLYFGWLLFQKLKKD